MGHYDDCYEADAICKEKESKKRYLEEVTGQIKKLDSDDLRLVSDFIYNIKDFRKGVSALKRITESLD